MWNYPEEQKSLQLLTHREKDHMTGSEPSASGRNTCVIHWMWVRNKAFFKLIMCCVPNKDTGQESFQQLFTKIAQWRDVSYHWWYKPGFMLQKPWGIRKTINHSWQSENRWTSGKDRTGLALVWDALQDLNFTDKKPLKILVVTCRKEKTHTRSKSRMKCVTLILRRLKTTRRNEINTWMIWTALIIN